MKNKIKRLRKQLRVSDITEFLAFETFPVIRYIGKMYRPKSNYHKNLVGVGNYITGEILEFDCTDKSSCKIFVRAVNKMLKETAEFLQED